MLNISVNQESAIVENTELSCKWELKTVDFFGNVYATLEKHFPDFKCEAMGAIIVARLCDKIAGKTVSDPVKIFGCSEIGTSLYDLIMFIDGKSVLAPTLKDIEKMRITHRMTTNYLPIGLGEKDSMRYEGLKTVTQVMIASLYYYAYHDYKLIRCKHCGKWFATKTLKKQFCDRISPCFGTIIKGKTPLTCEETVRRVMQKCGRIKNRIETKIVAARRFDNNAIYSFSLACDKYYLVAKDTPTVENLEQYYAFLCDTEKRREWLSKK